MDKKVYPTDNPINKKILNKWYAKNPEFGIMFKEKGKLQGVCAAIPLNKKGWEKLTKGKLAEAELGEDTIFDNKHDRKIGIHVYHIEKINPQTTQIYVESLKTMKKILDYLRKNNPTLKAIGFSGLCVTKEGINLFEKKLNCSEKTFINKENIFENEKGQIIVKANKTGKICAPKEYKYKNRCKMLVTTPKEKSIVWNYLN
jgi:hypothetical protein